MVSLGALTARLAPLDPTELLETPMIFFNRPDLPRPALALERRHRQVVGRPVFRVTVWGDDPKHPDHPIAFQMHHGPIHSNVRLLQGAIAAAIGIDLPIALEPRQPAPAVVPNRL